MRHAPGKLAWISVGETSQADQAQGIIDAFAMAPKQSARFQPYRNVAPYRPPRIKRWILENDDACRIRPFNRLAVHEHAADGGKVKSGNEPQQS